MLTEKEKETLKLDLKVKFGAYGNMKVIEDTIEATEQALLAKLQPEGMVETLLKPHREYVATMEAEFKKASDRYESDKRFYGKEADNGEFIYFRDGLREAKLILKVVENLVTVELSPYLLQAKEARKEIENIPNPYSKEFFPDSIKEVGKILKDKGLTDRELTSVSGVLARLGWENAMKRVRQALSSPATEKEGKK